MAPGDDHIAERGALEALVRFLEQRLLSIARTIIRDPIDAEDVFVDAMSRLLPRVAEFDAPEAFGRYARRAVRNAAVDLVRARHHRDARRALRDTDRRFGADERPLERIASDRTDPEISTIRSEQRRVVQAALSGLKEPRQTIVRLHYEQGLTRAEIGERLGLSDTTVKRHLVAARAVLAARLAGQREGAA